MCRWALSEKVALMWIFAQKVVTDFTRFCPLLLPWALARMTGPTMTSRSRFATTTTRPTAVRTNSTRPYATIGKPTKMNPSRRPTSKIAKIQSIRYSYKRFFSFRDVIFFFFSQIRDKASITVSKNGDDNLVVRHFGLQFDVPSVLSSTPSKAIYECEGFTFTGNCKDFLCSHTFKSCGICKYELLSKEFLWAHLQMTKYLPTNIFDEELFFIKFFFKI